jgi:5'-nucleotidase/UDP-sugar diphosphatase
VVDLPQPLDGRDATVRTRPGDLTELITASLARETKGVDVAILNAGSIRVDDILTAGPLTEYDIIRVLPFGGKVLRAEVTGALLTEILNAGQANVGSGGYLHLRGVTSASGDWRVGNAPIDTARWYSIAIPEFMLTGGEARMGFLTRANAGVRNVQEFNDIRQAVIAELKARYAKRAISHGGAERTEEFLFRLPRRGLSNRRSARPSFSPKTPSSQAGSIAARSGYPASRASDVTVSVLVSATSQG